MAKGPYIELHLSVAVTALDTELLEVAEDIEQLPLALVHEDASVELDELRLTPQREVDITNWGAERGENWGYSAQSAGNCRHLRTGLRACPPCTLPRSAGAI